MWPDCRNVRDVGGLVGADGRPVRAGALVRSDDHHHLTPMTVRAVRDSGVARIVDLRWAWECRQYPSPFAGDPVYRHVPMLADVLAYDPPPDTYAPMLDHNRERIAAAFSAVAQAPPGGVVVHCRSGRDRTGVLVGLLLAVAGVTPDDIAADYARTEGCSPLPMLNTLAHAEIRYGGAAPYLIGSGVEPQLVDAVRTRLLDTDDKIPAIMEKGTANQRRS
jgi:protein-tyrosine phosphatase